MGRQSPRRRLFQHAFVQPQQRALQCMFDSMGKATEKFFKTLSHRPPLAATGARYDGTLFVSLESDSSLVRRELNSSG